MSNARDEHSKHDSVVDQQDEGAWLRNTSGSFKKGSVPVYSLTSPKNSSIKQESVVADSNNKDINNVR